MAATAEAVVDELGPDTLPLEETDVVIIGAGPAGLSVGACLARRAIPFVILDKGEAVGDSWRQHYDRLHLHTAKAFSALPYRRFPRDYPRYPSRDQVVAYLEDYARHFELNPRFGQQVRRAAPSDGCWEVRTNDIAIRSRFVVVATSYNGRRRVPDWPDREDFGGTVIHSADFKTGADFRGKRVLVVGIGNSGGEIAVDLCEHEAYTCISVRSPVIVLPRDLLGSPTQLTGILMRRLPTPVADFLSWPILRLAVGDIRRVGLEPAAEGPYTQIARTGRIPLIDVGTLHWLDSGELEVVPEVERFTGDGVAFVDGSERSFDAIVLATGFTAALERFLDGAANLVDERGYPRWHGRESKLAGLFFVGFANPVSGALREIRIEAKRVAKAIARARARA